MKQEVNPQETSRAKAFGLWIKSPVPMVTFTKTFDVTRLYQVCKRRGVKFNTLLCWCMGRAASEKSEFYLLPENGKLYKEVLKMAADAMPDSKVKYAMGVGRPEEIAFLYRMGYSLFDCVIPSTLIWMPSAGMLVPA